MHRVYDVEEYCYVIFNCTFSTPSSFTQRITKAYSYERNNRGYKYGSVVVHPNVIQVPLAADSAGAKQRDFVKV